LFFPILNKRIKENEEKFVLEVTPREREKIELKKQAMFVGVFVPILRHSLSCKIDLFYDELLVVFLYFHVFKHNPFKVETINYE